MMFFDPRSSGAFLRLFIRGGAIYPIRQKCASPFRRRKGGSRRKFMGPARSRSPASPRREQDATKSPVGAFRLGWEEIHPPALYLITVAAPVA